MNLKRKNLAGVMLMKGKNYNLELIRMVSFVLVIAIHVTNYFCRAYGKIPTGGIFIFSCAGYSGKSQCTLLFHDFGSTLCWGGRNP